MAKENAAEKIGPGYRVGHLVVVSDSGERKNGYVVWNCRCDCGNEIKVDRRTLQRGTVTDCGCLTKVMPGQRDITGQRFGKLTAQYCTQKQDCSGSYYWHCICDCGGEVDASLHQLQTGCRKSCGCLSHPPLKQFVGRRFGQLTVTAYAGKKNGMHQWTCLCDCGNETVVGQSLDKEVGEGNTDSTYETTAEYDIGDNVSFTLIATLPSNYASYSTYKLTFHDKLSDGLSFNNDVNVAVYTANTNLSSFTNETTYYVKGEGGMVEVDTITTTTPASGTIYYTLAGIATTGYKVVVSNEGYYKVSITAFDSSTTYYTYDSSSNAYSEVDKTQITSPVDSTTYYVKDDCSFEVQIANASDLNPTVSNSDIIVVTYTAKLLDAAKTTETNEARLEYSNNPNDDGSGTGNTPDDVTTVFTFTLDVNKVDSDSNPLEGAGFTLYKLNKADTLNGFVSGVTYYTYDTDADTYTEVTDANGSPVSGTTYYTYTAVGSEVTAGYQKVDVISSEFASGVTYYTYDSENDVYTKVADTSGTPTSGTDYYVKNDFTFKGLAVGYYKLVETTTPSGYKAMGDFYFRVVAKTTETSEIGSVDSLTIYDKEGKTISDTNGTFTISADKLTISTDIENTKGSTLPSTGGIGTTVFYVIGAIMVFGAAVVLITRRRMKAE